MRGSEPNGERVARCVREGRPGWRARADRRRLPTRSPICPARGLRTRFVTQGDIYLYSEQIDRPFLRDQRGEIRRGRHASETRRLAVERV
jgi:hypothetical protein